MKAYPLANDDGSTAENQVRLFYGSKIKIEQCKLSYCTVIALTQGHARNAVYLTELEQHA